MARQRHIIVDGYNVLYAWPEADAVRKRNVDTARERLIDLLRIIHDVNGTRMTLVFDGQGARHAFENPTGNDAFTVVYTSQESSADAVIERLVSRQSPQIEVTVYSRDNLVAAATRACGGFLLPPEALWEWVKTCEEDQHYALEQKRRENRKRWRDTDPLRDLPLEP